MDGHDISKRMYHRVTVDSSRLDHRRTGRSTVLK